MFGEYKEAAMAKKEAVDKFLEQQAKLEEQKQILIKDLLEQRKSVVKEIDEQLSALGYEVKGGSAPKMTGQRKCGICGETGHNSRSCPNAKKGKKE